MAEHLTFNQGGEGSTPSALTTNFLSPLLSLWVGRAKCAPYSHFCAILPIDFLARRPQLRAAEFTIIPHRPVFVKSFFAQILNFNFPAICAFCQLDFWGVICYNHNCQEGKALDRLSQPHWDRRPKSRCVATMPILSRELPFEKKLRFFSKTLLTNPLECDTIRVSRGEGNNFQAGTQIGLQSRQKKK